jgi:hypothetical protein
MGPSLPTRISALEVSEFTANQNVQGYATSFEGYACRVLGF